MVTAEIQIRVNLEGKWATKFDKIKEHYGLKTSAEVIRLMITEVHRKVLKEIREERKFIQD